MSMLTQGITLPSEVVYGYAAIATCIYYQKQGAKPYQTIRRTDTRASR